MSGKASEQDCNGVCSLYWGGAFARYKEDNIWKEINGRKGGDRLLFFSFNSQEERRKFGGSCFIELQYCRLPPCTKIKQIVSVHSIRYWENSSLYIDGATMDSFYSSYGGIITGGIYSNRERGPIDLHGINFYSQEQASQIIARIEAERPPEYQTLLNWLKAGERYIGFYILGV